MIRTLAEIYSENINITRQFLTSNGYSYDDDDIKTKLIASIIIYNMGSMIQYDKFYVEHKDFNELYMMDEGQIETALLEEKVTCEHVIIRGISMDKIYVLKQIIDSRTCKDHKNLLIQKRKAEIHEQIDQDNWEFGNIINDPDGCRYAEAIIVGYDMKAVLNPDFSGSGYLTIPIEITQYLDNAYEFYKNVIQYPDISSVTIQFKHNDKYVIEKFGKELDKEDEIEMEFIDGELDSISVNGANMDKYI